MSVREFLSYLFDFDTTRELAVELASVCSLRTRVDDDERVLAYA
jgi:hypothetical protein